MGKGFFQVPTAINEPVKGYAPGSPEREEVLKQYKAYYTDTIDVPLYIGSEEIKTGNTKPMSPPHEHKHVVGQYHIAEQEHVQKAIANCLEARTPWANLTWEQRAAIFLKAAELIAGPMGNVCVWKPSDSQVYSAKVIIDVFKEAGLPDGVINMVMGDPVMISDTILDSPDFSGIHFTGSTHVFKSLWKQIGNNIDKYKTYPRIVGETGGKDFIIAHPTAKPEQVATAITRGAFEFQGQKCSAASRVYLPKSTADKILTLVKKDVESFNKPGSPEDLSNFITAVIHEGSFDKLAKYIDQAKADNDAEILVGGGYDKSVGYFIEPTVIVTKDPKYDTMCTELFGPVVTVYVYDDKDWSKTLELVDNTSEYALTGAVLATDRYAIDEATKALQNSAGNFYINDKPTGAVVGQQPFGGARASGTNDKAGSAQNLLRWTSPRLIKETFVSPENYRYPFLG